MPTDSHPLNEPPRLGGNPPPGAPDMIPPEPPLAAPDPAVAAHRQPRIALVVMIAIVGFLAVSAGLAAVALFSRGDGRIPVGTDLTEGHGKFDPADAADHYPFTLERDTWIPKPQGRDWTVQDLADTSATFHKEAAGDTVVLICGDLHDDPERYPDDFTDREAWFAAEAARDAEYHSAGDQYALVAEPEYSDYVIDGRQAFLVEVRYHWTKWEDPEAGPTEVDYVRAHAYLYLDRGGLSPARCTVAAHHGATDGYAEAVAAVLDVRTEAVDASD
ncbi:hypothetical protein L0U85_12490 [Glycomyces sp. L485]|uniref:hypothetical protein n=1 Tax=Glycomyces sp. L485 TaxID=2909235 RepID=UPI001F4A803A|nr:hypothetical protein [Glycomyces sp. L485]MCH7231662.1 hypothetical protein [Glycomyces sp. L485]